MKKTLLFLLLYTFCYGLPRAQAWVDTLYGYQQISDTSYGSAYDFAGNLRDLTMDICLPQGDDPFACGRPLMILVHGGAFMTGSKDNGNQQAMMRDFAKRGYVTASVNYRLGMFHHSGYWNCNISYLGMTWNCLNMQDTSEWHRAVYRAAQDVRGAIRFLTNNAEAYNIDADNVFIVGESAGGFVAMAAAYLDDPSEKSFHHGALANANAPNALYGNDCVVAYGLDTNIASMTLTRPDLGPIQGELNPRNRPYTVRGVGNFYGGMMQDLLTTNQHVIPPALYMYHQPNDLVVDYSYDRLFASYAYCCVTTFGCAYILNRPFVYGSGAIRELIDTLALGGSDVPIYLFDSTLNNADCAAQAFDASLVGHSIDNYALRTRNMAVFFADKIDTLKPCIVSRPEPILPKLQIAPNPSQGNFRISIEGGHRLTSIEVHDLAGKRLLHQPLSATTEFILELPDQIPNGTYLLSVHCAGEKITRRIALMR